MMESQPPVALVAQHDLSAARPAMVLSGCTPSWPSETSAQGVRPAMWNIFSFWAFFHGFFARAMNPRRHRSPRVAQLQGTEV